MGDVFGVDTRWGTEGAEEGTGVATGVARVCGVLRVGGIGLGLGLADRSKVHPKGDVDGDWVGLGVDVGALGLSAGVLKAVAVAFDGKPLIEGEVAVPTDLVSWDGAASSFGIVVLNRKLGPLVS